VLVRSEKTADELTAALADLTARRNALDGAVREHSDRAARLAHEIAAVEAELAQIAAEARADLAPLSRAAETAQAAAAEAGSRGRARGSRAFPPPAKRSSGARAAR